jgi:hypothetical protein
MQWNSVSVPEQQRWERWNVCRRNDRWMHPMDRTISIALFVAVVAAFGLYYLVGNYATSRFENSGFESRFPEKRSLTTARNFVA